MSSNIIAAPALVVQKERKKERQMSLLASLKHNSCSVLHSLYNQNLLSASSLAERGSHNNMLSLLSLDNLKNLEKWVGSILDQDKH